MGIIRIGGRGTSKRVVDENEQSNWTGPAFKQYSEAKKEAAKDQYISTGRGTAKIKFGDVSSSTSTASTKGMWVGTGRGTGRRKL
ncbi:MAG: hypothetical protein EB150_02340 [Nitrososphaeria archaeon]|nr:hypothetical protein [Nitrososphaeria archaeon]NDB50799.1 hypothetical protein [Nitrosopumilaceae archaeon]NDB87514.1 hypothetical protein [Nitrososphaerota archaeon]NDB45964.1 hypothetical protein [Nitrososphaeria archaeon]NDB62952.1 hypothetical protein [Nitrosopumilaceae archaeon]